jgi:hypothetical protein
MRSGDDPGPWAVASLVSAALVDEVADQRIHVVVVGGTDQRRRLTVLNDQPGVDQTLQMVGKRRSGDIQLLLKTADRKTFLARANQGTVDLEAGDVAKSFKLRCGFFDNHGNKITAKAGVVNTISTIIEICQIDLSLTLLSSFSASSLRSL